jgi:hypothetical protein
MPSEQLFLILVIYIRRHEQDDSDLDIGAIISYPDCTGGTDLDQSWSGDKKYECLCWVLVDVECFTLFLFLVRSSSSRLAT